MIGLGAMGSRIATRLVQLGHEVIVWNRSPEKVAALAAVGALPVTTPAEAARRAEMLITMVTHPAALQAVADGPNGIAAGARSSVAVIDMSTVGPAAVSHLASTLPAGVGLLDAPVLGSRAEAETGSLTIFVGGPTALVEWATPVLSALGAVVHMGALGTGAAAKLVANATLLGTLGCLGEAIELARGLALSREAAYRVLAATPLAAQAERRREALETGAYSPRFPLALARKDAGLIRDAAKSAGVDLRLLNAAETWLAEAEEAGLGERDYSAVLARIVQDGAPHAIRGETSDLSRPPLSGRGVAEWDALIVDLDGVVWRGDEPIEGSSDAVAALRANGIRVLFATNDPGRTREALASRLTQIGIPSTPADVVTSSRATAGVVASLEDLAGRRALVVGPHVLREEMTARGFELVSPDKARHAQVVVVGGHEGFDYDELRGATAAIRNGARLFATGRDAVVPTADGLQPATGAILAAVETAGGVSAVVVGKPEPIMFDISRRVLAGCNRIGVVGDHLIADVAGAKRAGMDAILVLTGATDRDDLEQSAVLPDLVVESLASLPEAMKARFATARSEPCSVYPGY